jgi:hypothetical protein
MQRKCKIYLNEGTGNDCPRQRIDSDLFCLTSISCKRPPEIFGATDPTGSELNHKMIES